MKENLHLKTLKIIIIFISIIVLFFGIIFFVEQAINFLDYKYGSTVTCSVIIFFIFIGVYCFVYIEIKDYYETKEYYEKLMNKREADKED